MKIDATLASHSALPAAGDTTAPLRREKDLGKACDQFEGMLIRQILETGMKPLLAKPPGSGAAGAGIYDYLFTDALAKGISGKDAMGISHLLQTQLGGPSAQRSETSK
jgi:hypothetical protein